MTTRNGSFMHNVFANPRLLDRLNAVCTVFLTVILVCVVYLTLQSRVSIVEPRGDYFGAAGGIEPAAEVQPAALPSTEAEEETVS